jgi:hypothetical protein
MTIDLGEQISTRSESGMQVRLYSDYPFKHRANRPPPDPFEHEALTHLRRNPNQPYYRFEDLDGRPVLRFATARVMEPACVRCHNKHPDRGTDWPVWKEGDVRGVLEIIRPLDRDQERIHRGMRTTFLLVAGSGASLLGLSVLLIYLGNRRNRLIRHPGPSAEERVPPPAEVNVPEVPEPEGPSSHVPDTAALPDTVPAPAPRALDPTVVWQTTLALGTRTPVRIVPPADGALRLFLEADTVVELLAEVGGEPTVSAVGIAPSVVVLVRAGVEVVVRLRAPEALDAQYTLTAELLAPQGA